MTSLIDMVGTRSRIPYQEAARRLLRESVLDAMRELLFERDWSAITMSDVAKAAGVSRQTLYNEFVSRQGLATEYILRLVDQFIAQVEIGIAEHEGDARAAVETGFRNFLFAAAADPAVQTALKGTAATEIIALITSEGGPVLERAVKGLAEAIQRSWMDAQPDVARIAATFLGRIALSYLTIPPVSPETVVDDFVRFATPFVESALAAKPVPAA
jgi:AcrR family transcriptional regulator